MEALHVAVLPRAAGFDVDRLDSVLREPLLYRLGNELAPVVASQEGRSSMLLDRPAHPLQNITALEGSICSKHMALAGVFIKDGEHPQGSTSGGSVTDEVPGPDMALVLRFHRKACRVASADHLPLGRRNSEAKRSPQTLDVSLAHRPSLLPKQGGDPAIAVAGVLVTQFDHSLQEPLLPRGLLLGTIPVARSRHFQDPTDLPARSQSLLHCFQCVCPATGRAQSFFSHTNLRTLISSKLSASIFLSSVFSRSSSFSLLASLTSICPNCFFHR